MVSGLCFVKDLGFTLKSRERSCFMFGKPVNSVDFAVLFVVVQIVVTVSAVRPPPRFTHAACPFLGCRRSPATLP